jgi:hypothetical protein
LAQGAPADFRRPRFKSVARRRWSIGRKRSRLPPEEYWLLDAHLDRSKKGGRFYARFFGEGEKKA